VGKNGDDECSVCVTGQDVNDQIKCIGGRDPGAREWMTQMVTVTECKYTDVE